MGLYEFMFGGDKVEEDLENTESFFSKEAGQKRTEALNKAINDNLDYYLGPTGIPNKLRSGNELLNPVVGISDAGQAVEEGRYLDAVTETAAAALPVAGAIAAKPLAKGLASVSDDVADAATALKETMLGGSFNPDRRKFVAAAAASPAALMLPPMDEVATATSKQLEDIFSPQTLAKLSDEDFSQMLSNLDKKMYDGELADELTEFFDDPASMPEIDSVLREAQRRGMYENSAFNTFLDYQLPETSLAMVPDGGSPSVISKVVDEPEIELPPASNSQRTQIAGTLPTYKKADALLTDLSGEGSTLDYGAGLGLSQRELGYDTFEPFPREGFEPTFNSGADIPEGSYKRITNLNVLNVVPKETRDEIVKDIGRILQPNGTAIITTRGRDVLNAKGDAGPEAMSLITSAGTYQKGFTQSELREYVQETLGDNFEVVNNKLGAAGVTIRKKSSGTVPAPVAEQTENMLDIDRRVDTRLPTSEKSSDFARMGEGELVSDGDAMFSANTNMAENFAMMAEYYPGMKNLWSDDVAETRANVTEQMTGNIVSLYDMSDRLGIAGESKQWYKGANRIALGLSSRFGVQDTKAAGVLAALSPQKNWFENVALAERLIKHHTELGPNAPWSQAMDDITTTVPPARKKQGNTSFQDGKNNTILESIKGKTWGELETPEQKGMWLRAYDEAHFGRQFREVSPEGDILGYYTKNDGTPALASHQGFSTLAKVVRILEGDGTLNSISPELGQEHKVRNFFNNILNPDSPKDVTVDTHQIAAGLFRPLGAGSVEVGQGLSGSNKTGNPAVFSSDGKATSGMGGTYGLYFDATTEGAKLRGVLPREMQSVSWEQLRTLFPDTLKRDKSFIAATEAIWRMVDDKQLDPEGARNLIIAEAEKRGQTEDKLIPSWKNYTGKRRDIGIATAGLMGAAGLATAEEAPVEEEGFATPQ